MKMYKNNGGGNLCQANKTRFWGIFEFFSASTTQF